MNDLVILQADSSLWPGLRSDLLSRPCVPVDESNLDVAHETARLLHKMIRRQKLAVGLAANQIGSILAIAALAVDDLPSIIINPEILSLSGKKDRKREACMSVWGLAGDVERRDKVTLRYLNLSLEPRELSLRGFASRVVQHEVDHLNGILYTSKVCGPLLASDIFVGSQPNVTLK